MITLLSYNELKLLADLIVIKLVFEIQDDQSNDYPVVVSGQGACPPEDSGGVYGWLATYEAYKDPKNPDHDDAVEWLTESEQLPEDMSFDLDDINQFLKARVKL